MSIADANAPMVPGGDAPNLAAMDHERAGPREIEHTLPCVKCWYDLRGLSSVDRCPECGTAVSRTLRSLFASSPQYLRAMHRRLAWLEAIWTVNFLLLVAVPLLLETRVGWLHYGGLRSAHVLFVLIPLMIRGAVLLGEVIKPEGRLPRVEQVRGRVVAMALNWSLGCAAAFSVGTVSLMLAYRRLPWFDELLLWGVCATAVLLLLRNIALAPHLRRIGRRLRVKLGAGTPWLFPMLAIVLGVSAYGAERIAGAGSMAAGALSTVAGIMCFISVCAVLSVAARFRRRLRDVIRYRESGGKVRPRSAR